MIQQILAALESKDKEQRKKGSGRDYKGILINNDELIRKVAQIIRQRSKQLLRLQLSIQ